VGILKWFTGKKSYIGMTLLLVSQVGRLVVPDLEPVWSAAEKAGLGLGAVGVAHKVGREAVRTR
jgi:hypothetical protein